MEKKRHRHRFIRTETAPFFTIDVKTGQRQALGVNRETFARLSLRDQLAALRGLELQPDPHRRG